LCTQEGGKKLEKEFPDIFSQLADNEKINIIMKEPAPKEISSDCIASELEEIYALLNRTGFRIRFETMSKLDPQLLFRELERTYARVVDIYLIAGISTTGKAS